MRCKYFCKETQAAAIIDDYRAVSALPPYSAAKSPVALGQRGGVYAYTPAPSESGLKPLYGSREPFANHVVIVFTPGIACHCRLGRVSPEVGYVTERHAYDRGGIFKYMAGVKFEGCMALQIVHVCMAALPYPAAVAFGSCGV